MERCSDKWLSGAIAWVAECASADVEVRAGWLEDPVLAVVFYGVDVSAAGGLSEFDADRLTLWLTPVLAEMLPRVPIRLNVVRGSNQRC